MFTEPRMIARHSGLGLFVYTLTLASVCGRQPCRVWECPCASCSESDGSGVWLDARRHARQSSLRLTNAAGMEVRAITYGVILVSIRVPDRQGRFDDIVIGHENLDGYLTKSRYFGAVVGRYGNRIAGGHVVIDGRDLSASR